MCARLQLRRMHLKLGAPGGGRWRRRRWDVKCNGIRARFAETSRGVDDELFAFDVTPHVALLYYATSARPCPRPRRCQRRRRRREYDPSPSPPLPFFPAGIVKIFRVYAAVNLSRYAGVFLYLRHSSSGRGNVVTIRRRIRVSPRPPRARESENPER